MLFSCKYLNDLGSIFGSAIGDIPAEKNSYLSPNLVLSKTSTTGLLQ